ncbi:MAG: regulatory protein GemA [Bauldia sp.]
MTVARAISGKQLALLHVAKSRLALDDGDYRAILASHGGGVESASDLDAAGFTMVMHRFAELGFQSTSAKRGFGSRAGMASPRQIGLIRKLWAEWSESAPQDEAAINRWLERHYAVSALRFLTAGAASKAITGLKAMAGRKQCKIGLRRASVGRADKSIAVKRV